MDNNEVKGPIPELFFHTLLTVVEFNKDTSGAVQTVYVLGTHTCLPAAKEFALHGALQNLGYQESDFESYTTKAEAEDDASKDDGTLVHARTFSGQILKINIDTKPNEEKLPEDTSNDKHLPLLPFGCNHLHYVLQTKTDYNQDRSGGYQTTEVEGCFAYRATALDAAKRALLLTDEDGNVDPQSGDGRDRFLQYDERDSEEEKGAWPFGEDTVVHAVADTGENYTVRVVTVPGAHDKLKRQK